MYSDLTFLKLMNLNIHDHQILKFYFVILACENIIENKSKSIEFNN
jgi:hypothetical protein